MDSRDSQIHFHKWYLRGKKRIKGWNFLMIVYRYKPKRSFFASIQVYPLFLSEYGIQTTRLSSVIFLELYQEYRTETFIKHKYFSSIYNEL